jgi:hypothetical protein
MGARSRAADTHRQGQPAFASVITPITKPRRTTMSFTTMHNDHLDPDRHNTQVEPPEAYQTVLDFFSAESEGQCKRNMYKYTDCGAWLEFTPTGIVIGSIVEGCDFGTATYPLHYKDNFTSADIQARIDAVEREAEAIWDWANVLRDRTGRRNRNGKTLAEQGCDAPDISYEYGDFEQGERSA